nr:glycoside hydrolase family 28 protein [Lachnospiraceae bacterium]
MEISLIMNTARSAVIEIKDGGIYNTEKNYEIHVNKEVYGRAEQVITSLYGLKPDTEYHVEILEPETKTVLGEAAFKTDYEFVTLNVKEFGAKGDGIQDDTTFIQAAIMACPKQSRVLIPKGTYKITSLFLKSDLNLELAKDAELLADNDRWKYPIFPGLIESYDEKDEYNLGTWEGNPLKMFTGIITGINAENIVLY